jgi:hypothetical protein
LFSHWHDHKKIARLEGRATKGAVIFTPISGIALTDMVSTSQTDPRRWWRRPVFGAPSP